MKNFLSIIVVFVCLTAQAQEVNVARVGRSNFEKIVAFIQRNGRTIVSDDIPVYKSYSFKDSDKNVHEIRLGGWSNDKIVIDSHYKGNRKMENCFDWTITEDYVTTLIYSKNNTQKQFEAIQLAYKELLEIANKDGLLAKEKK
jgi:hypothetical protein